MRLFGSPKLNNQQLKEDDDDFLRVSVLKYPQHDSVDDPDEVLCLAFAVPIAEVFSDEVLVFILVDQLH